MPTRKINLQGGRQRLVPQNKPPLLKFLNATTDPDSTATSGQSADFTEPASRGLMNQGYLEVSDLLHLRLVSKCLKEWVALFHSLLFSTLYIAHRFRSPHEEQLALYALVALGPYCRHLAVRLDAMLSEGLLLLANGKQIFNTPQSLWMSIFEILTGIATLTISAPGEPDWHAFGTGEALLESIRVALETKLPRGLYDITLSPINATGLLHFRWRGAAFQETLWTAQSFWSRLKYLSIDLHNPLPYYKKSNKKDFIKALHDYLGSFNRSLLVLRFSWLGHAGPNPLLLDLRYGGKNFSSPAIKWTTLEKVFLKNVLARDGDLVALRRARVPQLQHFELEDERAAENEVVVWEEEEEQQEEEEEEEMDHMIQRGESPELLFGPPIPVK